MKNAAQLVPLLARWAAISVSLSALLFLSAGGTQFPWLRYYLAIFSAVLLATMLSIDPGLAEERAHRSSQHVTAKLSGSGFWFLATLSLAAMDVGRLHWLNTVPGIVQAGALFAFAGAGMLQLWAMVVNPFFAPEIRIQAERGHRLIVHGPYRFIRHPGYFAMLVSVPASALAIGSWLALVPATAFCLTILRRVIAEDIFLRQHLPGYADYALTIRGHLLPAISPVRFSRIPAAGCKRVSSTVVPNNGPLARHNHQPDGNRVQTLPFSGLLSCRHGRLSKSPAPWRRGALLLPLRGPPGFRLPPKKIGPAKEHLFRLLQKMQSLAWGAGATCLRVPRKRAGQKKEIQIMYQNRVSLIGFVGNDVQLKNTKNGTPVAVLSVATKSSWKNGKGDYDSRTEWHRCTAWGKLAEFAGKLEKGAHVQIDGELRYREYKKDRGSDADAIPVKRRLAEIHASRILKLDHAAKQDEPVPEGGPEDFPVEAPAA